MKECFHMQYDTINVSKTCEMGKTLVSGTEKREDHDSGNMKIGFDSGCLVSKISAAEINRRQNCEIKNRRA